MALIDDRIAPEVLAEEIFGPRLGARTIGQWARQSKKLFVRNHTHVARWSGEAKGRVLTAHQALEAFTWAALRGLAEKQVVPIVEKGCEVAPVLQERRAAMGLSIAQVARKANVSAADISAAEAGVHRVPIRILTKLASTLALDDVGIGTTPAGGGDVELGVRLRELQNNQGGMSPAVVLGLAEAAWVVVTQSKLDLWLSPDRTHLHSAMGFRPISALGNRSRPAWREGIELAHQTRELLGLPQDAPIRGLKKLVEDDLNIPVVQVDLPDRFAGATIANGGARGIAVNVNGINQSVWTRRMTVAHEVGHLLWDPDTDLNRLRVDDYSIFDMDVRTIQDRVEMRANAFAAEFIAPQAAVVKLFKAGGSDASGVSDVMQTFGISFSSATWQIYNGLNFGINRTSLRSNSNTVPSDEWNAEENSTVDFFPLRDTPIARVGRFAEICVRAFEENLISADTAADYLAVDFDLFMSTIPAIKDVFGVG